MFGKERALRVCRDCRISIAHRNENAIRCRPCADKIQAESRRLNATRYNQKIKLLRALNE
jgi:hypothetical protein